MLEIYVSNNIRSIIMINDKHLEIFANIYLRINSMWSWGKKTNVNSFWWFPIPKDSMLLGYQVW